MTHPVTPSEKSIPICDRLSGWAKLVQNNRLALDITEAADLINHLTNVNDGLRETLDVQREGLAELRAMVAPELLA